jgi:urease accessory protein
MLRHDMWEMRSMNLVFRPRLACVAAMAAATLTSLPAMAHPGHAETSGFLAGFAHPLGGIDHVLAMLGVGLFAARAGGRAVWALPAGFMVAMVLGAAMAAAGTALPAVEPAIAMSVVAMGLLMASGARLPMIGAIALVAAFAVFHGHAHGAEAGAADFLAYAGGFLAATGVLHASGIALGRGLDRLASPRTALVRAGGGGLTVLAGILLLAA